MERDLILLKTLFIKAYNLFLEKNCKYFLIRRKYLKKAYSLICNHTGKSLIIGRFSPFTRSTGSFMAGSHKIRFSKFIFYDIIGNALWVSAFIGFGYLFGHSYNMSRNIGKYMVMITVIIISAGYLYYFMRIILKNLNGHKHNGINC